MTNRFKDYIAVPKSNGYQSLHTTVLGLSQNTNPTEIQIQTQDMYHQAKYGSAAHWAYKKAKHSDYSVEFLQNNQWLDRSKTQEPSEDAFDNILKQVQSKRIHVFTPKGDIVNLSKDASPVDFAYAIHSSLGESIISAKVNGNIKPLNYELQSDDVVEIITKKGRKPNPLWLKFVKSQSAKSKIRTYLNKVRAENIAEKKTDKIESLSPQKRRSKLFRPIRAITSTRKSNKVMVGGETDIPYKFASCCKPKSKDSIIAYNSRGLEFVIHRTDCHLLSDLDSARFMDAVFLKTANIEVLSNDRIGLLKDILAVLSGNELNITQSTLKKIPENKIQSNIQVEYTDIKELKKASKSIERIPNVLEAKII